MSAAREVELLVIGGGISGAGIALEAARRGIEVTLIEARDFAWGSSSRSSASTAPWAGLISPRRATWAGFRSSSSETSRSHNS